MMNIKSEGKLLTTTMAIKVKQKPTYCLFLINYNSLYGPRNAVCQPSHRAEEVEFTGDMNRLSF